MTKIIRFIFRMVKLDTGKFRLQKCQFSINGKPLASYRLVIEGSVCGIINSFRLFLEWHCLQIVRDCLGQQNYGGKRAISCYKIKNDDVWFGIRSMAPPDDQNHLIPAHLYYCVVRLR